MRIKILSKIFAALFCSIVFASAIAAQEKPQALKFDEFAVNVESEFYSNRRELTFDERVERFAKQVEKERGVKVFIFYYQARITERNYYTDIARQLENLKYQNIFNDKTKVQEFYIIDDGYREKAAVEFWIVPKDAEPPAPTPTIDKAEAVVCPSVAVWGKSLFDEADTVLFTVGTDPLPKNSDYPLKWKVSGGEIVGEQNLREVKVKLNGSAKQATAYVEIENLPYPCPKVFSASATVNGKLHLTDDFGREPNGQIRSRLDNFLTELSNHSTARGYVINYGSRQEGKKILISREKLIRGHFAFRMIDASRITIIDGGYREDVASELWLSFDDNQKPVPTPTVDKRFVGISKSTKKPRR